MATEARTQEKLIRYLKKKGCYVLKPKPGPGVPVGCPDVLALFEGFWAAFEVKATPHSKLQPLQVETLLKFEEWSFARIVTPSNIDDVVAELETIL